MEDYIKKSRVKQNSPLDNHSYLNTPSSPLRRRKSPRQERPDTTTVHQQPEWERNKIDPSDFCDRCRTAQIESREKEDKKDYIKPEESFLFSRAIKSKSAHGQRTFKKVNKNVLSVASKTFTKS